MKRKMWIAVISLVTMAIVVAVGCSQMKTPPLAPLPPNASREDRELRHAETLAKLGNWDKAGPIFRQLESAYRQGGDTRNELYARVSRQRADLEFSNLQQLSQELRTLLNRPEVQSDLALKQRILETKGNADLNIDGVSARSSFEELERVAELRHDRDTAARASGELGIVSFLEGNASEAKRRIVEAIAKAFTSGDVGAQIRYLALMGQGLAESRRPAEAIFFLDRALNIAGSTPAIGYPKVVVSGKANALTQLSRFVEAQRVIEDGLKYAVRSGSKGFQVDMLAQSGNLADQEGNVPRAITLYEEASALAESIHFNRGLAEVNARLALLYQRAGNLPAASARASRSVRAHRELGEGYVLPHHLAIKGSIETQEGDYKTAEKTFTTAERIVSAMLQNTPTPGVKRAVITAMSEVFTEHFKLAVKQGDLRKAYEVIEEARGRVAADRLRAGERTKPMSKPEIAADERRLALLQMRLLDTDDLAERERLSESLLTLETQMTSDDVPDVLSNRERPSLADLQRSLLPDETLLEYVVGERTSHCLVITRNRVSIATLPDRKTIEALSNRFLDAVAKEGSGKEEGSALHAAVLGPMKSLVTRKVIIVPDGSLHRIPFAAISDSQGQYLLESHTISYSPSGTVLTVIRQTPPGVRTALLAVGGVPYSREAPVARSSWHLFRGLNDLRRRAMAALPGTVDELRTVSTVMRNSGEVLLTGDLATETNFKHQISKRFAVVHLAVHAFVDRVYPDRAGLVLGSDSSAGEDGLLQVREIRRLPLSRTSLVTLSACDTSSGRIEGQEGVSSIVYAFLYAGARTAVASLWMVDDSATSELMKAFYTHLASGNSKAEALRMAQLELARAGGDMSAPVYWAAFNLMGEGADAIERN